MAPNPGSATMSGITLFRFVRGKAATLLVAALTLGATTTRASDPIGVYALVDKVVFEPNEPNPERIQVWGAFAFATGSGYAYDAPKRGFLYYKLNPAKKEVCLKEWADFKSVAGAKQVVGFGNRYEEKGTLRKADDKPANPDKYPLGFGVIQARDKNYEPVRELLKLGNANKSKKDSSDTKAPEPPKRKDSSERKAFRVAKAGDGGSI